LPLLWEEAAHTRLFDSPVRPEEGSLPETRPYARPSRQQSAQPKALIMNFRYFVVCCALCAASGCTDVPLRKNSLHEAGAIGDIQTQQVLDNLAMFVCDPNAMPYFSYPSTSAATVTDTGSASGGPTFAQVVSGALNLNVSRSAQDSFTLTPVNDPRKLDLMRCAYQRAVSSCCGRGASTTCPDCQTRFNMFYTGDPNGDIRAKANGIVTSECLNSGRCWFQVGCKKCLAKRCHCNMVGRYRDTYVWVGPEGRDELTKLTLAILDYAMNSPPTQRTKEVVYYLDEYGLPTTDTTSVGKVTATIAIDENNVALLNTSRRDEARIEQQLDYRLRTVRDRLAVSQDADEKKDLRDREQRLEAKLDFLHEQIRAGALREQYYPTPSPPAGTGILGLQQQLGTVPAAGTTPHP
jgi:hypothetical protein